MPQSDIESATRRVCEAAGEDWATVDRLSLADTLIYRRPGETARQGFERIARAALGILNGIGELRAEIERLTREVTRTMTAYESMSLDNAELLGANTRLTRELEALDRSHKDLASRLANTARERDEARAALKPFAKIAADEKSRMPDISGFESVFVSYSLLRHAEIVVEQSTRGGT